MKLNKTTKKNLLDLQYNKYLQYYNTAIIILFTYFIAVLISYLTKQINYQALYPNLLVGVFSIFVISTIVFSIINFKTHLKKIQEEIKTINI